MPCCSADVCSGATRVSASAPKPVVTPYIVRPPATARSTTSRAARTRSRAGPANVTCAPRATATTSSSVSGSPTDTGMAARLRAAEPAGKRRVALGYMVGVCAGIWSDIGVLGWRPGSNLGIDGAKTAKTISVMPSAIANGRPYLQIFSMRITAASAAITAMFMAPTATRTIMRPQQQPTQ